MTAATLVAALRSRGVQLVPIGDRIRFRPASKVPPELLTHLRQRKAEVLVLLARDTAFAHRSVRWWSHPWPDELGGLGIRHVGPFDLCAECERWSWVRYGNRILCLACATKRLRNVTQWGGLVRAG